MTVYLDPTAYLDKNIWILYPVFNSLCALIINIG